MRFGSIISEAAGALNFNRQRSLLTMASLGWGVACFVILSSYGEGFGFALRTSFQSVGQDLVLMFGGETSAQAGGQRSGHQIRFDLNDVELIRENVPQVSSVSAETMIRGAAVLRGTRQQNLSVRGVEPAYGKVRNMTLAEGRWINGEDYQDKQRVAILGDKAAHKLFGEIPPVGETIAINGIQFNVIGLLKTKVQISNYNTPDNECVFIPLSTASVFHDIKHPDDIVWTPANPVFTKEAVKAVRASLSRVHNFLPNDEQALQVFVFNEFAKVIDTMALALQILLGLIGALTLAIGGVGLANIMLVSVTQRTKEIGILKSLGATRGAILWQFLVEAMAIVTLGGLFGVFLGWAVTAGIQTLPLLGPLFKDDTGSGDIHLHLSRVAVITSTAVLEIIGLFAGWLPALKASRLDPIDALHYE